MSGDPRSAFHWNTGEPSIFCNAHGFPAPRNGTGMTQSQIATRTVLRIQSATGRSPGTVFGISDRADKQSEEHMARHRAARARRAGQ